MKLEDWYKLAATLAVGTLVFVLWTEYAYQRGYEAASYECYYDTSA
jgi:hypothetical protein